MVLMIFTYGCLCEFVLEYENGKLKRLNVEKDEMVGKYWDMLFDEFLDWLIFKHPRIKTVIHIERGQFTAYKYSKKYNRFVKVF